MIEAFLFCLCVSWLIFVVPLKFLGCLFLLNSYDLHLYLVNSLHLSVFKPSPFSLLSIFRHLTPCMTVSLLLDFADFCLSLVWWACLVLPASLPPSCLRVLLRGLCFSLSAFFRSMLACPFTPNIVSNDTNAYNTFKLACEAL